MKSPKVTAGQTATAQQHNDLIDDASFSAQFLVHQQTTASTSVEVENWMVRLEDWTFLVKSAETKAITLPSTNNQYVVLSIALSNWDLVLNYGTEAASPTAPSIWKKNYAIAAIYLKPATVIKDSNDATNSYIIDLRTSVNQAPWYSDAEIDTLLADKLNLTGWALTGALLEYKGANKASASTVNLATATWNFIHITGTTDITSFWTVQAWARFIVTFDWVLTLTHNGTSLILPWATNITTAAGDIAILVSEGSWNWRCVNYAKANWKSVISAGEYTTRVFTAWEDITSLNMPICIPKYIPVSPISQLVNTWWSTSYWTTFWQTIDVTGIDELYSFDYHYYKWVATSYVNNIIINVYNTYWGALLGTATTTIWWFSWSGAWEKNLILPNIDVSAYNSVYFELVHSWSYNAYFATYFTTSDVYAWWTRYSWGSPTTWDIKFVMYMRNINSSNKVFIAKANNTDLLKVFWFNTTTASAGGSIDVSQGVLWGFSLTKWFTYFLSNTWTLATTPWTNYVLLWTALDDNLFEFFKTAQKNNDIVMARREQSTASWIVRYYHDLKRVPETIECQSMWGNASLQSQWKWTHKDWNLIHYVWSSDLYESSTYCIAFSVTSTTWQYWTIVEVTDTYFDVDWFYDTSLTAWYYWGLFFNLS